MDEAEAERLVDTYSDMILRLSYTYLKNTDDAEDICQEVFLKMLAGKVIFENTEHEKAWIIRVTVNKCKDLLKSAYKQKNVSADTEDIYGNEETYDPGIGSDVFEMVMSLPLTYRNVIYLYYYEGYKVKEIAEILDMSETSVMAALSRGRKKIRKDFFCENADGNANIQFSVCKEPVKGGTI